MKPRYLVSDRRGVSGLQNFVARTLVTLFEEYFHDRRRRALVGSNQFIYYKRGDPRSFVVPDLYIIDDETEPQSKISNWKVWERGGRVPSLALEIVCDEFPKPYAGHLIERYGQLGVRELIRHDPDHASHPSSALLRHFVRDDRGRLVPRPSPQDRIRSAVHDVWLVHQPDHSLRLGCDPDGTTLWPTWQERRVAAEAELALRNP